MPPIQVILLVIVPSALDHVPAYVALPLKVSVLLWLGGRGRPSEGEGASRYSLGGRDFEAGANFPHEEGMKGVGGDHSVFVPVSVRKSGGYTCRLSLLRLSYCGGL